MTVNFKIESSSLNSLNTDNAAHQNWYGSEVIMFVFIPIFNEFVFLYFSGYF